MKENIMRDKIISFVLWLLLGATIVYWYSSYIAKNSTFDPNVRWTRGNFDTSTMSDDQLQRMADRAWITLAELKQKLASGQSLRDVMSARTWSWSRTGGDFQWRNIQDSTTSTWSN
jgi:hypothetical protein